MKGGTAQTQTTSQIKQTPTAEQIRYAQMLDNDDLKVDQDQIKQVAELTGKSIDEVCIALHDCNYDTELTINSLLEGRCNQNEWVISSNRKKKHQGSNTTQGIDSISTGKQQKDSPRPSRGSRGGRNRPSDKPWDSDQRDNHDENRLPSENGRGRGLRDDRSSSDRRSAPGRGGPNRRGRGGGNRGRSSSRGRGGRIGKSGPPVSSQPSSNGPTVNGTEMWDSGDAEEETKTKPESWEDVIPSTESTWDSEPYISPLPATVKEPVAPTSVASLFSSVSQSNWTTETKDQPWGNSNDSVTTNGTTVPPTTREQTNESSYTPESVDVAIIHSKLQSPARQNDQSHNDSSMMHMSMSTSVNHNHLGPISKLLDSVTMSNLTQQTPSVSAAQPQRQPKPSRSKKSQKSQIPLQAVEMPDSMLDDLDVQFGHQLEFGGDFSGSPLKTKAMESAVSMPSEDDRAMSQSTVEQEPISALPSTLSSSLSRSVPVTIASTTSAGSSMTGLDDNSPRHYPHASPREHKTQVPDRPSTPPSKNESSSLSGVSRSQSLPSASLQSTQLVSSLPKESTLDRAYQVGQHQHVPSQSSLSSKDQLTSTSLGHHSTLGGTAISNTQRTDSTSTHPLQPPPGVGVPAHTTSQQTSTAMGLTTATVSSSSRAAQHSGKPSLPPGVLPMNTLYGMQQPGMVPGYSIPPFNYEELQRQIHIPQAYYDMSFSGHDNIQGSFQNEQKFGRSDASSPVQTTVNQPQNQHHMQQQQQQQAYLNAAATMPGPYGFGGLAFYPGGGMMPGGFPTYTPPMYQQMTPKTHVNVSQYQPQAFNSQHGSHNYTSGYDDLSGGHDFNKSPYHSSVTQTQSKTNTAVSTSTDLGGGSSYKSQVGKYNESKAFLGGTPPPLSLGQHSHLGNYGTHTTPFMNMLPTQQHHPHSLFHHHSMQHQHQDIGQTGIMQRGQQSQLSKQSQNKGGHQGSYPSTFWSSANKS